MTHFESINEDLGDCLFGDSASPEDIKKFIENRTNAEQDELAKNIQEAIDPVLEE